MLENYDIAMTGVIIVAAAFAGYYGTKLAERIRQKQDEALKFKKFKKGEVVVRLDGMEADRAIVSVFIIEADSGRHRTLLSRERIVPGDGIRLSDLKFGEGRIGRGAA